MAQLVSDPDSPYYDVTADPASIFYVGPPAGDHLSGDEIRAEVTDTINRFTGPPGGFLDLLFGSMKESMIQRAYEDRVRSARDGLGEDMELRAPGAGPKTLWVNASHEQMVEVINSNADSSVVAVSSEEWVRLGNDLAEHQRAFSGAINDSLGNWQGSAGDAARTHLAAVAKWLGSTAEGSVLTGRQQEIHSQVLSETQKAMANNPPVPFSAPEANARLAGITDPVRFAMQFSAEMDTYHRQQVARDQAAQLMLRFDDTIAGAVTTPKFTPPPSLPGTTKSSSTRASTDQVSLQRSIMPTGGSPHLVLDSGVPGGSLRAGAAQAGSFPNVSALSNGVPSGVGPGGGPGAPSVPSLPDFSPSGGPSGTTGAAGYTPAGSLPTPHVPDLSRSTTVPSGAGNVPTFSSPFGNDDERTTRLTTGGRGRPAGSNVSHDGRGFGPGGAPSTGGGPGLRSPGLRSPSSVPGMPGSVPGTPGSVPGTPRSVPGTPGGGPGTGSAPGGGMPGGRGGFGPMGGGGALGAAPGGPSAGSGMPGRGGQGDDKEYQGASYLEGDSELFAPGEVVSPPVIGDWNNKEDWK